MAGLLCVLIAMQSVTLVLVGLCVRRHAPLPQQVRPLEPEEILAQLRGPLPGRR